MKKEARKSFVPDWAKGIVWYHIFPERFCNGDTSNDPGLEDQKGSWPHDQESAYQIHPWGSDWYERQPYEVSNGLNLSDTIQRRRYGGDLQGIINKLDYLSDLGVKALYLNPVFEAPSSHKYDAATWHHVDPNFGPDPKGDRELIKTEVPHDPSTWKWTSADKLLLQLIEKLHEKGMYIILDGVFNHMGLNSWVYRDIVAKQRNSDYKKWMKVHQWADETEDGTTIVKTWEGFRELPEIKQNRFGLVKGPAEYVFNITNRWMDPENNGDTSKGIDGWRLDVAFCIKHPFWEKWRRHVRSINPRAFLCAEVIDSPEAQIPYLQGDEFDAVMNYNFAFAVSEFFIPGANKINPEELDKKLESLREAYPEEVSYVMHNLLGSHDTDRIGSRIMNSHLFTIRFWNEYYEKSKMVNPGYITAKPDEHGRTIQKLMTILQMTYIGAPVIYYGDEAGMWGANDPCNRKPMIWPEIKYDSEAVFPNQNIKTRNIVSFDEDLHLFYRELIHLRNNEKTLRIGKYETIVANNDTSMFGFRRILDGESVAVLFNTGKEPCTYTIENATQPEAMFMFNAKQKGDKSFELQPNAAVIFRENNA